MRITGAYLVTCVVLYVLGAVAGGIAASFWLGKAGIALVSLVSGLALMICGASIIWNRLHWVPLVFPKCPTCGKRDYSGEFIDHGLCALDCAACKTRLRYVSDKRLIAFDANNATVGYLDLRWPYFVGLWRSVPKKG